MKSPLVALAALLLTATAAWGAAVPVRVEQTADGYRLLRGGTPYLVKGAGGSGDLDQLVAGKQNPRRAIALQSDQARVVHRPNRSQRTRAASSGPGSGVEGTGRTR